MAENDIDFIEIIEPVLDNQSFMLAVVGGIVVGVIAVYGYMEYLKTHPRNGGMMPERLQLVEAPEDAQPDNVPEWAR